MGLLDSLQGMMGQGGEEHAKAAGGLMEVLQEHPGGLSSVLSHLQNNGVDTQAVQQGQPMAPDQVQQGLGGSGIIDQIAQRTGMSPEMVKIGLATALPLIMAHFTKNGTQDAPTSVPSSGLGGIAGSILGKFL